MDVSSAILEGAVSQLIVLFPIFQWFIPLFLLIAVMKSPWFKGMLGEWIVMLSAKLMLPKKYYHRIYNVTLPTPDGTTQIDHIFVSRFGIFVVETKHMKGWIFGSEKQATWTQKIFKKSYKFQNPLRQNYKHLKALENALTVPIETLHSVIVFTGECEFKTVRPDNVFIGGRGFTRYIKMFQDSVFSEQHVLELVEQIKAGRLKPSYQTHREHVKRLKSHANPEAQRLCPKCGSTMVIREVKKGANTGKQFWGCSAFPKCRTRQALWYTSLFSIHTFV